MMPRGSDSTSPLRINTFHIQVNTAYIRVKDFLMPVTAWQAVWDWRLDRNGWQERAYKDHILIHSYYMDSLERLNWSVTPYIAPTRVPYRLPDEARQQYCSTMTPK
jgi:hypothetical protein